MTDPAPQDSGPQGVCDPRFASVREVFAQSLAEGLETGASVSVAVDGRVVVDLWAASPTRRAGDPGSATRS